MIACNCEGRGCPNHTGYGDYTPELCSECEDAGCEIDGEICELHLSVDLQEGCAEQLVSGHWRMPWGGTMPDAEFRAMLKASAAPPA